MVSIRRSKAGFLIWGRAASVSSNALPSSIKKTLSSPQSSSPSDPSPRSESSSIFQGFANDKVLEKFSGEPQIVNHLTISQLTSLSRADPGCNQASLPQLFPLMATTSDQPKGTYRHPPPIQGQHVSAAFLHFLCIDSIVSTPIYSPYAFNIYLLAS